MSLLDVAVGAEPRAGNLAAWFLSFHGKEPGSEAPAEQPLKVFGFDQYYADITAALPKGLDGGSFTITLEGMTDEDYKTIRRGPDDAPAFARLYLGWADTNASLTGYLASTIGPLSSLSGGTKPPPQELLVAVLSVDQVSRKAGSRRYEATITGRDWIFAQVTKARTVDKAVTAATLQKALETLLEETARLRRDRDYKMYPLTPNPDSPPPKPKDPAPKVELKGETSVADILAALNKAMAINTGRFGRGMLLLRDGVLHLGVRNMPLVGDVKPLTLAGGMVEATLIDPVDSDPDAPPGKRKPRRHFKLTLKGRPDLKPGDLVRFDAPPEDTISTQGGVLGVISNLAAGPLIPALDGAFQNPVLLHVDSVEHRLARTSGFVTNLTGVEVVRGKEWDSHTPAPRPPEERTAHANPELEAAQAIRHAFRGELGSRAGTEIAEVRSVTESGTGDPPGQTEALWRGLAPADANGYAARRADVRRPSLSPAGGAPYLTPFAFGKCGLVLPRYPGTRVAVIHREGQSNDPIDVGALWPSGRGPDKAKAGDWWLSLPSAVVADQRARIEDSESPPPEYNGKVTQDLIDADGNRVIEVGELTIRVGRNVLHNAGERPSRGQTQDAITIEHADGGAQLVLKSDGSIQLKGTNIEIDAGSGKITLKASQVDVP